MNAEWFCRDFTDTGAAFPPAVAHLDSIREQLEPKMLYGFNAELYLMGHPIEQLPSA
jgi:hypothetical protein